jgi:uncharacterized protein (DUF342 family)
LSQQSADLDKQLQDFKKAKIKNKNLLEKLIVKMKKKMDVKMKIDKQINDLTEKRRSVIRKEKVFQKPVLRVYGEIYPGSTLSFHNVITMINDRANRKMFYLDKGEIRNSVIIAE